MHTHTHALNIILCLCCGSCIVYFALQNTNYILSLYIYFIYYVFFPSYDSYMLYVFKRASGEGLQAAHSKSHQLFAKLFLH